MSPQDRSLLIGGAAFILAMVGLYLGMAVVGTGEPTDTKTDTNAEATAEIAGAPDRDIGVDGQADADVVARLASEGVNGGIDPAGPSAASDSPATDPAAVTTTTATTSTRPTTSVIEREARASSSTTTVSVAPTAVTEPATTSTELAVPPGEPTAVSPVADPATTATPVPTTVATTAPPTTVVASTEPAPTTAPSTDVPSTDVPSTDAPPVAGLDAVEQEIVRLTNELRADPAGRLARQKPMPACVTDPFYGISVDAATGQPTATPPLVLDERVSVEMSRPWAVDMDSRNNLQHRANGSQLEIYRSLGITVSATGENIAWFSGYPDEEAARVHFEGWRESDTGHYCAMVSGTYANIGVGHFKGATRSWAVQNFYATR